MLFHFNVVIIYDAVCAQHIEAIRRRMDGVQVSAVLFDFGAFRSLSADQWHRSAAGTIAVPLEDHWQQHMHQQLPVSAAAALRNFQTCVWGSSTDDDLDPAVLEQWYVDEYTLVWQSVAEAMRSGSSIHAEDSKVIAAGGEWAGEVMAQEGTRHSQVGSAPRRSVRLAARTEVIKAAMRAAKQVTKSKRKPRGHGRNTCN